MSDERAGRPLAAGPRDVVLSEGVDGCRTHVAAEQRHVDEGEGGDRKHEGAWIGEHTCRSGRLRRLGGEDVHPYRETCDEQEP